ncbi:AAA family ATPase [Candidatus Mycoplasma pogonae]
MQQLIGKFFRYIFKNETTSFYVGLFKIEKNLQHENYKVESEAEITDNYISVSSNKAFEIGIKYQIVVTPDLKSKYKNSFKLQHINDFVENDTKGIINYLSSKKFPGVGKTLAAKIVDKLGLETLDIIKNNPNALDDVEFKLSNEKKAVLIKGISSNDLENKLLQFFQEKKLSMTLYQKIINTYGANEYYNKFHTFPFLMWLENHAFDFYQVDNLAKVNQISDFERRKFFVLYQLINLMWETGSTRILLFNLFKKVNNFLILTKEEFAEYLKTLIDENLVILYDKKYITSTQMFNKETFITDFLDQLKQKHSSLTFGKIDNYFDSEQRKAIENVFTNSVNIITGAPGTGKTEILKAILFELSKTIETNKIVVLAPTGRAAYQIWAKTNFKTRTIHSFLGWQNGAFELNANNQIDVSVLIIDEFSMVDINLFYDLLQALNFKAIQKIILIGDKNQIPSISEGYLLNDFINAKKFNVNYLEKNYRQLHGSNIISEASLVNQGLVPSLTQKDCYFVPANPLNFYQIFETHFNSLSLQYSIEDLTILAPMYDGITGIDQINIFVQTKLFQHRNDVESFINNNKKYFIGDKIIQLDNNYENNVFNGEIGYIESVHYFKEKIQFIIAKFMGNKLVKYTLAEWSKSVTLGYAISIHKFQGSESLAVMMIIFQNHSVLLSKKLFYTAMTRAREQLLIIGETEAIVKAVQSDQDSQRLTNINYIWNNSSITDVDSEE